MENELTGCYPIIINGSQRGSLEVTREGLFWCFSAESEKLGDEIVRLSVYGDGGEGYLGVMEPEGEKLHLKKKLSRSVLAAFPKLITHGGRQGEDVMVPGNLPVAEAVLPISEDVTECTACSHDAEQEGEALPAEENIPPPKSLVPVKLTHFAFNWAPCPCPCSLFSGLNEKSGFGRITGALSCVADGTTYLAVPQSEIESLPATGKAIFSETQRINDSVYGIFKLFD